jgi:hypothetical protein
MSTRRRHPPSPIVVLERLEKELQRNLSRLADGELVVWLRFGAIRDPDGRLRGTIASRPQPQALEALEPHARATLAEAMREAADVLDPRPQE